MWPVTFGFTTMKDSKVVNELEDKVLKWQVEKRDDPLIKKFRENPKFSPNEIQSLIEELTLRRVESAELQEIRKELEESRREYHDLFEFHPDGFVILNDSNYIKATNLTFAKEIGQKGDKLIGVDFLSLVDPDFQEGFNLFLNNIFQSRQKRSCGISIQKKDGDTLPVILTGCVRKDSNGQFEVLLLIAKNQSVAPERDHPLVIVDIEGNLIYFNKELLQATGDSPKELLHHSFADFLWEDDRYKAMRSLLKARMGIPVFPKVELRVTAKNQNTLHFRTRPRPLLLNGQPQGFIAVLYHAPDASHSAKRAESRQSCLQNS